MTKQIQPNYIDANFPAKQEYQTEEIDFRELFRAIFQGKWIIAAITAVFAIVSVTFAVMLPDIYKSEALLAPASEEQNGSMNGLAGQFGGLASLAGINFGASGGVDKVKMAIEVMKSRQFTNDFIQNHNILPDLMAAKKWNMSDDSISYDNEIYDVSKNKWLRKVNPPYKAKPSMQEAFNEFRQIMDVHIDKENSMITVAVKHLSPTVAYQWVTWLVKDINKVMKERDVNEANRSTEFLTTQIGLTNVADIRSVLYKLIEEQAKTIMFAEVRDEYAFKTIDPAIIPEVKSSPKRGIISILGTLIGFMLGFSIVLIRYAMKSKSPN